MSARQLLLGLVETPAPTFDNFVTGRNGAALAALHALGNMPGGDRCLYFWGVPGSGRSHLLAAWRAAHAGNPDCHAVDDVQALDDAAQIALFNLYNRARGGEVWLLVAGDLPPAQLAVRDDVKSRLAWGLGFEILPLTDEEKRAALAGRARQSGLRLTPEMIDYLMARSRRDMPSLIALVDAIDRHSLETKRPVTLPMLRDLLNQNQSLPL
jgi:DnaA family protein